VAAANWLTKQPNSPEERRVAFLVCDGKETGSHVGLADAVKALQRASSPIFIFTPSDVEKRKQGQYLRQLAEESGGQVYFLPPNTKHVTFDGLKRDLADRFLLT
jgi:Mg-chelatase subunit ChlD